MKGLFGKGPGGDGALGDALLSDFERRPPPLAVAGGDRRGGEATRRQPGLANERDGLQSRLSAREFMLLAHLGGQPLTQIRGAGVYRVGWEYLPALAPRLKVPRSRWDSPYVEPSDRQKQSYRWGEMVLCELDTITHAWDQSRRRALEQLTEAAVNVGADTVVGVKVLCGEHDWTGHTVDYVVSGIAIRSRDAQDKRWPVLSDLSVQEYWRLRQAGYEPAGLVATTAVIFVSPSRSARLRRLRAVRRAQEWPELSRAVGMACDTVRARMRGQVDANRATGVVGVEISRTERRESFTLESSTGPVSPGWRRGRLGLPVYTSGSSDLEREGWVITVHASGTAIRPCSEFMAYSPETVMGLGRADEQR